MPEAQGAAVQPPVAEARPVIPPRAEVPVRPTARQEAQDRSQEAEGSLVVAQMGEGGEDPKNLLELIASGMEVMPTRKGLRIVFTSEVYRKKALELTESDDPQKKALGYDALLMLAEANDKVRRDFGGLTREQRQGMEEQLRFLKAKRAKECPNTPSQIQPFVDLASELRGSPIGRKDNPLLVIGDEMQRAILDIKTPEAFNAFFERLKASGERVGIDAEKIEALKQQMVDANEQMKKTKAEAKKRRWITGGIIAAFLSFLLLQKMMKKEGQQQ